MGMAVLALLLSGYACWAFSQSLPSEGNRSSVRAAEIEIEDEVGEKEMVRGLEVDNRVRSANQELDQGSNESGLRPAASTAAGQNVDFATGVQISPRVQSSSTTSDVSFRFSVNASMPVGSGAPAEFGAGAGNGNTGVGNGNLIMSAIPEGAMNYATQASSIMGSYQASAGMMATNGTMGVGGYNSQMVGTTQATSIMGTGQGSSMMGSYQSNANAAIMATNGPTAVGFGFNSASKELQRMALASSAPNVALNDQSSFSKIQVHAENPGLYKSCQAEIEFWVQLEIKGSEVERIDSIGKGAFAEGRS